MPININAPSGKFTFRRNKMYIPLLVYGFKCLTVLKILTLTGDLMGEELECFIETQNLEKYGKVSIQGFSMR